MRLVRYIILFIVPDGFKNDFYSHNSFKFLTQLESKMSQFEIVFFKLFAWFNT